MIDKERLNNQYLDRETTGNSGEMYPKLSIEPAFFLLILVLSIFLGEIIIMIVLPFLISPHVYYGSVLDALLLVVIVFPILYMFSFKPLRLHIMELKRMQEELKRSEERYRSLVESTEDSIYMVDKDYKYLFMNTKHQSRMGIKEDQCKGRPYGDFHSPEDTEEFENKIDEVFKTGNSIRHEHKSHRDNRYFIRTFSPIKDPFGMVEAVTVISKDVTELRASFEK